MLFATRCVLFYWIDRLIANLLCSLFFFASQRAAVLTCIADILRSWDARLELSRHTLSIGVGRARLGLLREY